MRSVTDAIVIHATIDRICGHGPWAQEVRIADAERSIVDTQESLRWFVPAGARDTETV